MQKCLLLILLFFPALLYSQININKKKTDIKKEIEKLMKKNNSITVSETDSSFLMIETKSENNVTDRILQFDKSGSCKLESISFNCDSCYKEELDQLLALKKYNWKKINENQYISKFEDKLMIEIPGEGKPKSFNIIRMDWSKLLYEMLKGN